MALFETVDGPARKTYKPPSVAKPPSVPKPTYDPEPTYDPQPTYDPGSTGGPVVTTAPDGAPTPGTATADAEVEDLRARRLEAAMASISATFGGNIAEQQALLAALDPAFSLIKQQNIRDRRFAMEAARNATAERGIFRSGITATNVQRASTPYTEALAQSLSAKGVQEQQYLAQIEQFKAQQAATEIEAQLASEKDALDYELYLASMGF